MLSKIRHFLGNHSRYVVLLPLLLSATVVASIEQLDTAAEVVRHFQADLLSAMKRADELGYEGRYERLAPSVKRSHDLSIIARIAVGKTWKDLTSNQKKQLIETFSRLSISTYAHNFSSYAGERFEIVSVQETPRKDKLIRTRLIEADGNEVSIDYVLRRRKERWLIVNIIAEGVSDLALKRSEYSSVLRREGFDVLIVKLEEKINKYSSSKSE